MSFRWIVIAGALAAIVAAPLRAQQPSRTAASDTGAVHASIEAVYARYAASFAAADPAGVASLYDEKRGARLADGGAVVTGRTAITADLRDFLGKTGPIKAIIHSESLWLLEGRAIEAGTWSYTFTPRGRAEQTLRGRYVTEWIRQADGSWKMGADIPVPG